MVLVDREDANFFAGNVKICRNYLELEDVVLFDKKCKANQSF